MAQMWSDKCIWAHGFIEFGDGYPSDKFTGQLGELVTFCFFFFQLAKITADPTDKVNINQESCLKIVS